MPLKDLVDNDATAVAVNTKVRDVAKIMKDREVGVVVVVKRMNKVKKIPVGIVTDRDIALHVGTVNSFNPDDKIEKVMNHNIILGRLGDGLAETIRKMKSNRIKRLPIVNGRNYLVGMIDSENLLRFLGEEIEDLSTIRSKSQNETSKIETFLSTQKSEIGNFVSIF